MKRDWRKERQRDVRVVDLRWEGWGDVWEEEFGEGVVEVGDAEVELRQPELVGEDRVWVGGGGFRGRKRVG